MHSALLRIRTALARHGVAGTATRGAAALRDWRSLRRGSAIDAAFDREHGVDTAGIIPLDALDVTGRWVSHGNRYEATTPTLFRRALDGLQVDLSRFTFVDIGAGKGRALLLASEYPFRRIIGVEFSPELVAVARGNVARWLEEERTCREITLVCSDATEYELPREPLVLYFYNPFDQVVMRDDARQGVSVDSRSAAAGVDRTAGRSDARRGGARRRVHRARGGAVAKGVRARPIARLEAHRSCRARRVSQGEPPTAPWRAARRSTSASAPASALRSKRLT